jgi:predicted kinase
LGVDTGHPRGKMTAAAMSEPILVVVAGPPASGKSTLAERLAEALELPLVTKDGIKETLFDSLGTGERDWSRQLGEASWQVLFHVVEAALRGGSSLVVEGNFEPAYAQAGFASMPPFRAVQVYCTAPPEIFVARYRERVDAGERHPGHVDEDVQRELVDSLATGRWRPLELGGPLVEAGHDDDPSEIVARVRELVSR